jgi:integrase
LEKYDYKLPYLVSDQRFNEHIKVICGKAEIDDWRRVKVHTARRSFATNSHKAGIPNIDIMQATGHTTEKTFEHYIKMSTEEKAERLKKHPWFSKKQ